MATFGVEQRSGNPVFRIVVLHRERLPGTAWEGAAERLVDGFGISRRDAGDVVIFDLSG